MTVVKKKLFIFLTILTITAGCQNNQKSSSGDWFVFSPANTPDPGVIGMAGWLEVPAGLHGFVQVQKEDLIFEDGTAVKFWGTNICSQLPFSDTVKADSFVQFLSRYGVNAVRFHKFSWYAYDHPYSTRLDPEKFRRLDYFQSKLREKGIYYGWSHIYGHRVQPGDSAALTAYREIKNLAYPWSHLNGSTSGLVNFAPDLQKLSIALTVNMLNHVNPYTGLRYADDPALAFVEFQNEDNIFWASIEKALEQAPTYRKLLCRLFSEWLERKYLTQTALVEAWGRENIPEGESLAAKNIYPQPNHGIFDWAYREAVKQKRGLERHLLDKMRFLYETQLDFYKRFEAAVRATGYRGVLVGSCWQAGSGFAHFYNLYADYQTGVIDRHNYFGGGAGGHTLRTGKVNNNSLLQRPGSGLLGIGMQQVVDRPFSFSEWMSMVPNEWTAEAAPLIAAYGMGLQGWDASFSFAVDMPRFSRFLESEKHGVYNVTSPLHIGLYPTLARMVYRNDVEESPVLMTRNVCIPDLAAGVLGIDEWVEQNNDVKRLNGTIPSEVLAIGRIPVKFSEKNQATRSPDWSSAWDRSGKHIQSVTNQLYWSYDDEYPYFTINTPATKGAIGFIRDEAIKLEEWSLQSDNRFAVILITCLGKDKTLNEARQILITTIARARNSGMIYTAEGDSLIRPGRSPLQLEAVNVTVKFPNLNKYTVEALDHDGQRRKIFVPVRGDVIHLDGSRFQTLYYLLQAKSLDNPEKL